MCLSLIQGLDPERTIVTILPVNNNNKMKITYSMNTKTNEHGHFLMCIPFKIPNGAESQIVVDSLEDTKALFNALKRHVPSDKDSASYRCLSGGSCVERFMSGPFEVFLIKNTSELQDVERAMQECGISESRQKLMIKQMTFLNCSFILAKYMPVENLLYDFFTKIENFPFPTDTIYELTREVVKSTNTVPKLQYQALFAMSGIKEKIQELKSKYIPQHEMRNGLCIEVPFQNIYPCMFVLHEWENEREQDNPRKVNQKIQILCHEDYEIQGYENLDNDQSEDQSEDEDEEYEMTRKLLTDSNTLQALHSLHTTDDPKNKIYEKIDRVVLYNYYGTYDNKELTLIKQDKKHSNKRTRPESDDDESDDDDDRPHYRSKQKWRAEGLISMLNII
tara:strand:- start:3521 stop:4696 length:1176 start_codon:yes stop_codon:yes gene_type:complete